MYLDDVFDLLALIFILGVSVVIGVGISMTMNRDDYLGVNKVLEDKTAPSQGYVTTTTDYGMSKLEAILMTQVQEFGVPEPKKFKIGNEMVNITASYRESENLVSVGVNAYKGLKNGKYEVVYNTNGTPTDKSDDYYEVREMVE